MLLLLKLEMHIVLKVKDISKKITCKKNITKCSQIHYISQAAYATKNSILISSDTNKTITI